MLSINKKKLESGSNTTRAELTSAFGLNGQGGVEPSIKNKKIFLFSTPKKGEQFGYDDGWNNEQGYDYFGHGPNGDMKFGGPGNRNISILRTRENGFELHLFRGPNSESLIYLGKFKLDKVPYIIIDSKGNDKKMRKAIVFKLQPSSSNKPIHKQINQYIPVFKKTEIIDIPDSSKPISKNSHKLIKKDKNLKKKTIEYVPSESDLEKDYNSYRLKSGEKKLIKKIIKRKGFSKPLFIDGYCEETKTLYEAKKNVSREKVRMAIGQLYDYNMDIKTKNLVILVPSRPREDMLELIHNLGFILIYKKGEEFISIPDTH